MNAALPETLRAQDLQEATEPPEARGLARDEIRMLVATPGSVTHARYRDLGEYLAPGDLVVVNVSATIPAAVDARRGDGRSVVVHFSAPLDDGTWTVELRKDDASGPWLDAKDGEFVELEPGGRIEIVGSYTTDGSRRVLRARPLIPGGVGDFLARHGRPIGYCYLSRQWPLAMYQTVFARIPGSAEMPSAGRGFTTEMVTDLVTRGVLIAPITLHTGVSSQESHETPLPERFDVPSATAAAVNSARERGSRIVAVGTTVTRAIESAAGPDGRVQAAAGWTDLVLSPRRPARVVDALITGWHAPEASHLLLLQAVAGSALVRTAYRAAAAGGYLWHEFGDACLLLP